MVGKKEEKSRKEAKGKKAEGKNKSGRMIGRYGRRHRERVKTIKESLKKVFRGIKGWYIETMAYLVEALLYGKELGIRGIGERLVGRVIVKYKIKRVYRFISNEKVEHLEWCERLVRWVSRGKKKILIAVDWTKFGRMDVLVASAIMRHGRALPIYFDVCETTRLSRSKNAYEVTFLRLLRMSIPKGVKAILVMDRGFDRSELKRELERLGYYYVIRQSRSVKVRTEKFEGKLKELRVKEGEIEDYGRCEMKWKEKGKRVECRMVTAWERGEKEGWILMTNLREEPKEEIVRYYRLRFRIEEGFRDIKNNRWGWKMRLVRLKSVDRYARMMLVATVAMAVAMLIGWEGEKRGYDKDYKANTTKRRTHSLVRLGSALVEYGVRRCLVWLMGRIEQIGELLV